MHGILRKMLVMHDKPVRYELPVGEDQVSVNALLGHHLHLRHTGKIFCIQCGRKTQKSFQQGYCFPCYRRLGECNLCMIHPERCKHGEGNCTPDDWVHASCMVPHIVYLANSSGLKVGITRQSQMPTRWIDQGAIQALPIFSTLNRFQAGIVEVALKKYVADKTNWRLMLSQANAKIDLVAERDRLLQEASAAIDKVRSEFPEESITLLNDQTVLEFLYPVIEYPEKIRVLNLEKATSGISGRLMGIKGQYLIFNDGVMNIRKYGGYEISLGEGCCG